MSGLLIGVLLARTAAGLIAQVGSWRLVYFVAAGAMVAEAAVLRWRLPTWREETTLSYPRLVRSVWSLLRQEPPCGSAVPYGLLSAGAFNAFWTSMAFLLAQRYHLSTATIGLFGLVGAAGAAAASVTGRLADRDKARLATGVSAALLVCSWGALWSGTSAIAWFVVGVVALDIGAQGLHVTNQGEIYRRLHPGARSRLTSAYMVSYFIGAAGGSALSAVAYHSLRWDGTCLVGAAFAVASLALWALSFPRPARFAPCSTPA